MSAGRSARDELRAALTDRLRRSPLDFVREMEPSGDRTLWLEKLAKPIDPADDLTFTAALSGVGRVSVCAEALPWDTAFFGFPVARLNAMIALEDPGYQVLPDLGPAVDLLVSQCRDRGVAYVFAPVDARDIAVVRALTNRGFELIESRLYSHRSLLDFEPRERFDVRLATRDDVQPLSEVAATMVNPYDRFHADPVLVGEAGHLMREWVRASICDGFADATMVPDVATPRAFLTIKEHRSCWERWGMAIGQAPFGAVAPEFRGWYVKLISEICCYLRDRGAAHFYMITQATNGAVVRGWEKLGLRYGKNELILRRLVA